LGDYDQAIEAKSFALNYIATFHVCLVRAAMENICSCRKVYELYEPESSTILSTYCPTGSTSSAMALTYVFIALIIFLYKVFTVLIFMFYSLKL
jgi:hypothetical protein